MNLRSAAGKLAAGALAAPLCLAGCGTAATSPSSIGRLALTPGPYRLMAQAATSQQTPCAVTGPIAPTFQVFARLTMARDGADWVARSPSAADGDIELRIHEVASPNPFEILVSGTLRGSGVDTSSGGVFPAVTMSFAGLGGAAAAQISGQHAPSVEVSFGIESFVGTATVMNHRGDKAVCTSLWEWSIQPGT